MKNNQNLPSTINDYNNSLLLQQKRERELQQQNVNLTEKAKETPLIQNKPIYNAYPTQSTYYTGKGLLKAGGQMRYPGHPAYSVYGQVSKGYNTSNPNYLLMNQMMAQHKALPEFTVEDMLKNKDILASLVKPKEKVDDKPVSFSGSNAPAGDGSSQKPSHVTSFTATTAPTYPGKLNSNLIPTQQHISKQPTMAAGNTTNNSIVLQTMSKPPQLLKTQQPMPLINQPRHQPQPQSQPTPPQHTAPIEKKQQKSALEFSDSLKRYIERAFSKCKTDSDRTNCDKALVSIINSSQKIGDFHSRNWDNYPLPKLPSEEAKTTMITRPAESLIDLKKKEQRKGRFNSATITKPMMAKSTMFTEESIEELVKNKTIIGTCTNLEKQYLRVTALPDPSTVRPEPILKRTLKMLKDKWKAKEADYNYISEQFRSIRQDMTIQHIKNDFTVKVYETHARIALESFDLDQFNQCQTQLALLYGEGLPGRDIEFLAYKIIYLSCHNIKEDLLILMQSLTKKIKENYEIEHAIKCCKALSDKNYFKFFELYKIAPNMGQFLIECFLPRMRVKALQIMLVGYLNWVQDKLVFASREELDKFITENSTYKRVNVDIMLTSDGSRILCKESITGLNNSKALQHKHTINHF